jgi:hypothetical protein
MAFQSDSAKDPKEIEALINEFGLKLDRLKILYEQYFMGIEKREPTVPLKDVVRVMRSLEGEQIRNTGLRFRYRTLVQRLNTYRTYWNRTLREIERGTYHRDLARLRRKMAREGVEMAKVGPKSSVAEVERAIADAKAAAGRKEREGDAGRSALPSNPLEQIRGVSGDQLRRGAFDEAPTPQNLGRMDVDEVEDEEETGRHASGQFPAQQAQGRRPSGQLPGQQARGRRPSGQFPGQQRGRHPSGQFRGQEAQGRRTPSAVMPGEPGDLPPVRGREPSSPEMGRPRARSSPDVRRQAPPGSPRAGAGRPAARSSPAMQQRGAGPSDRELKSLYQRFVRAKELCGEDTTGVRLDTLKKSIEHQMPKLRKMYKGREVEFQVVIRSGRAILKAKPK